MQITYFLGAGASANAVPIVKQMNERMVNLIDEVKKIELLNNSFQPNRVPKTKKAVQADFLGDLQWLADISANHASIDTVAKKFYITRDKQNLDRLKNVLSVYLILEQSKGRVDLRYDSFFASILESEFYPLPKQIRIVTWNYDFQLEKAYSEYSGRANLLENQSFLGVINKFSDFNSDNKFCVLRLNGSSNYYNENHEQHDYFSSFNSELSEEFLVEVLFHYAILKYGLMGNAFSGLSFAWEGGQKSSIVQKAIKEVSVSNIIVCIGYSFPYFNREIDRAIFDSLSLDRLQKVYFQSPDAGIIKERFLSVNPNIPQDRLITRVDKDQFLLPNEL